MEPADMVETNVDRHMDRDLRTLARFIQVYCDYWHKQEPRSEMALEGCDIEALAGRSIVLCEDCSKLLAHAVYKRSHCPMSPKPACRKCTKHCYHPLFRQQIRQVMKFSGRRLLLSGRLDYLWHLIS
jgi:hypothetical protein